MEDTANRVSSPRYVTGCSLAAPGEGAAFRDIIPVSYYPEVLP